MITKRDPQIIQGYLEDSSNLKGGHADEVVIPQDVGELSDFLKRAYREKTPVTVSGGGTGVAGGRVPFGGAVLSLEKFIRIVEIGPDATGGGKATVEAGVLVEDLKVASERKGLFYTCHPTEETAFVGGTIATNASGARSFKYGPTRRFVNKLKMVLSGGEVLELTRGENPLKGRQAALRLPGGREVRLPMPSYKMPSVKHSAGYFVKDDMDLIDIFIGQEGTLSVIVEIEIGLVKKPEEIFACFTFFGKEEEAWSFSQEARAMARAAAKEGRGAIEPLAVEYFDRNSLELLLEKRPDMPPGAASAIYFEQEMTRETEDEIIDAWQGLMSRHGASPDTSWVAMTGKEVEDFHELRHAIPEMVNESFKRRGFQKLSTDIAVPEENFSEMARFYRSAFESRPMGHVIFGHIGECHLHVNVFPGSAAEVGPARELCLDFVKKAVALGGTVSAEHGIGKTKHHYLEALYGREGVLEMARLKKALDPACILGLDTIFSRGLLTA